ncbi:hypothetical protein BDY17DRAFT_322551 [Neohortaea acidophila]|uniref:Uncharacterized protein n=1 Tax=Neohortaea acidophila TaxID=245834 RepID=A0A6A6Q0C7_9PEZI|nr:uncharacterized protein BDY17DRAFT_322551 [Neohortaea acidophila]KAF2485732.1 hypothetical protein BDY17DRAFT_322551 [Neohortaea acidophila]
MDSTQSTGRRDESEGGSTQLSAQDRVMLTSDEVQQFYANALDERYSTGVSPPPLAFLRELQARHAHPPSHSLAPAPGMAYQMDTFDLTGVEQLYISGGPALSMEQQVASLESLPPLLPVSEGYPGSIADAFAFSMDQSQQSMYSEYEPAQQEEPPATTQSAPSHAQFFEAYHHQIRTIFTLAHHGSLRDIGGNLLVASHYLLDNVEALGLTRDEQELNNDRLRLWGEFNYSWLVTLQKQLDLSIQDHPLLESQSIMSVQALERLSSELVRLCDGIERFGLVDYQMGVEEEDIMDLLLRCLDALGVAEVAG